MKLLARLAVLGSLWPCCGCSDDSAATENPKCGDGKLAGSEVCDDGAANGEPGKCLADCSAMSAPAIVKGVAALFNDAVNGRIADAKISVLEHPELTMTTQADGLFEFDGLYSGEEVTLVLEHQNFPLIQTGTHTIPPDGIDDLTFQVPTKPIYTALASIVQVTPDPSKCQMVTTITRKGGTILAPGAHGEAGATVSVTPEIASEHGPIYFNASVIPDKTLEESSEDGGVLFTNVEPGEYVWSGHKVGATLTSVKFKCRAGVLVNASPPRGMNVQ